MIALRHRSPLVLGAACALAGAVLSAAGHPRLGALAATAVLLAFAWLLDVELPWGGSVPLGHALAIAVPVLVRPAEAAAVIAIALAIVLVERRQPVESAKVALSSAAAVAAVSAAHAAVRRTLAVDTRAFLDATAAGTAFLAVDFAIHRRHVRQVGAVYVALLCAAALLAVAFRHNPALSVVAAVPLLVTRYSFERFSSARRAYAQTTEALSLLPEVAGLTPLGHGARTAVLATALAEDLGFDDPTITRIATAARLHHIGYISLHEPEERTGAPDMAELGRVSGDLLRETGFLVDVADLVEQAQAGGDGVRRMEAAVVRVCSTLDDLTAGSRSTDPFAEVLRFHDRGLDRTAAIALLRLHDRRPSILEEAAAASLALTAVAAGGHAGHDHGDDEPHDCR